MFKIKFLALASSILFLAGCRGLDNAEQLNSLREKVDSLNNVIADKESDIEILEHEIEMREDEISYIGHSLDSCRYGIKP